MPWCSHMFDGDPNENVREGCSAFLTQVIWEGRSTPLCLTLHLKSVLLIFYLCHTALSSFALSEHTPFLIVSLPFLQSHLFLFIFFPLLVLHKTSLPSLFRAPSQPMEGSPLCLRRPPGLCPSSRPCRAAPWKCRERSVGLCGSCRE